jgi:hypothetical protein
MARAAPVAAEWQSQHCSEMAGELTFGNQSRFILGSDMVSESTQE